MNLVDGIILETKECDQILENLERRINNTLSKGNLNPKVVIDACDHLVRNIDEAAYLNMMSGLGINKALGKNYLNEARHTFSAKALNHRLEIELGRQWAEPIAYMPLYSKHSVTEMIKPLGVLLHVAAGNADGLPAFSVLEGLLTGNINILKLPAAEGGISVRLLLELIKIEPGLAEYIYVFDYSSKDIIHIEKLVHVADAIVVWGGEEAVSAFRKMLKPNIKLIEWGHKVSFAYVTERGITDNGLEGIAQNIIQTGQLLCSSCQGIFLDTNDMDMVCEFCDNFLPVLQKAVDEAGDKIGIGIRAKTALELYNAELETIYTGNRIFKGNNCSLTACNNKILEPSIQFGNAWVKPLPQNELLQTLRPYKNFLQTVGLLCEGSERDVIANILFKTGVVRVCSPAQMSVSYCGEAHDGEYPMRRYTKVVNLKV